MPDYRTSKFLLNWKPNYGKRSRRRPERTGSPAYSKMLLYSSVLITSVTAKLKHWPLTGYNGDTCYAAEGMCVMQATLTSKNCPDCNEQEETLIVSHFLGQYPAKSMDRIQYFGDYVC